ncbi:hypothetical protein L1987_82096 [Smallanthus sonchifolius]|uniref:Uncharacterized protein n=1 Tax=Smallanthus sonchifolius TaxID=185202 RepID=A0ACB8YSP1_9ASTR|nr:hypothetical protein L1987_82096 [Smallanthus sonchifolius]
MLAKIDSFCWVDAEAQILSCTKAATNRKRRKTGGQKQNRWNQYGFIDRATPLFRNFVDLSVPRKKEPRKSSTTTPLFSAITFFVTPLRQECVKSSSSDPKRPSLDEQTLNFILSISHPQDLVQSPNISSILEGRD